MLKKGICKFCGKEFQKKRNNHFFCHKNCSNKHKNKMQNLRKKIALEKAEIESKVGVDNVYPKKSFCGVEPLSSNFCPLI